MKLLVLVLFFLSLAGCVARPAAHCCVKSGCFKQPDDELFRLQFPIWQRQLDTLNYYNVSEFRIEGDTLVIKYK